jgi:hypothetical protein
MRLKEQTTARDPIASSFLGDDGKVALSGDAVAGDLERISQPVFSK